MHGEACSTHEAELVRGRVLAVPYSADVCPTVDQPQFNHVVTEHDDIQTHEVGTTLSLTAHNLMQRWSQPLP